ncbi:MAG: hypothetical protein N2554_08190 [Fimbriimonadales bacterium]|nr:hypothetical protein [Fimbriimonadales bacterium]
MNLLNPDQLHLLVDDLHIERACVAKHTLERPEPLRLRRRKLQNGNKPRQSLPSNGRNPAPKRETCP